MRKVTTGLAPEGWPCLGLLTLITLTFALLDWDVLAFAALILTAFALHFFRDPERAVPTAEGVAVSPADGKIIRIAEREDPFCHEPRVCVSIFMNVFNVHVNRSPVAGTVADQAYEPGAFFNAAWDKASRDNERCAWSVRDAQGENWSFVQIAGLVARRISPRAEPGDVLARGERFGMIRFGSRVDLYLPQGYSPAVGIGEHVFAGQTVIARTSDAPSEA